MKMTRHISNLAAILFVVFSASTIAGTQNAACDPVAKVDPLTRYIHITYPVPPDAGDNIIVLCSWSPASANTWQPARVTPFISETALTLVPSADWTDWTEKGRITERHAAGLDRTVVFNPYPEAQQNGRVDIDFRIELQSPEGKSLTTTQTHVQADHSDVICVEDWSAVLQKDMWSADPQPKDGKWSWRTGQSPAAGYSLGNGLYGFIDANRSLPQLTYPLDLKGPYAVFVATAPGSGMRMRFTGDERTDTISSRRPFEETFWRWTRMDRQHLVLKQAHGYTGYTASQIDYIRFVPLTNEQVKELDAQFGAQTDKLVAGYFEPYSWAFYDNIQEPLQHREPLLAFREARIGLIDSQIGRFGMKVVYESRQTDPLYYSTIGDPEPDNPNPQTNNVGRMQQYTNTLDAELRYARELGLNMHANFGASNCYPGTPLQGDFSKQHPDWMRGACLRYEVPEVRQYVLSLYREALEIGAPGISIDFCRYPGTIDSTETCTTMLRELRQLADEAGQIQGRRIPILVRFPGAGVERCEFFDYSAWVKQNLVDHLCPSDIQGRFHHIDMAPYLETVRGSSCKLLPVIDGLTWGPQMPGFFLWRVASLYKMGIEGVYVYQADARVLNWPGDRRCMRLISSSQAVQRWWDEDQRLRPARSKGVYLSKPEYGPPYHKYERLRVWLEGLPMGELEMYLDGQLATRTDGPPYTLGKEDYSSDDVIPAGDHELRVRVKDGEGWFEQTFRIQGA